MIGRPYEEEEEDKVEEVTAPKSPGLLKQRLDQLKVAQQIDAACRDDGFLLLTNFGLD